MGPGGKSLRLSFRLRGMAVDYSCRRQGVGLHILKAIEKDLRAISAQILWFNARQSAFQFYESQGYSFVGELFDIPNVGLHKVMYKIL